MKKNWSKDLENQSGITLIALVITIIVLLILTGVVIVSLTGENGLINRATQAKDETVKSGELEEIQLAVMGSIGKEGKIDGTLLAKNLKSISGITGVSGDAVSLPITVNKNGNEYNIDGKGNVKALTEVEIKVGNTNIKSVSDLTTLYGENTNYTSVEGITWQLFYDDATNIYLIARDQVPSNLLPNELIKYGEYSAEFGATDHINIINKTPWSDGADSIAITGNPLTNTYLKWVNSSAIKTRNYENMHAVAFMMDTAKWSSFAGNAIGAYAIGGPTIEMFVLSYNSKHSNQLGTYQSIIDENSDSTNGNANSYGYYSKLENQPWHWMTGGLDMTNATGDTGGNMWVRKNYCLASPSALNDGLVIAIRINGLEKYAAISYVSVMNDDSGFRPLIVIPKSSLK